MLTGGAWQPLPNVSPTAALLLPSTASLRLVTSTQTGAATLTFVGWDQTSGSAGQTFDATNNAGATAFSSQSCTLSTTVEQAAPSWNASTGAALPVLAVNGTPSNNITVASVFSNFFQDTNPATTVGIAVAGATGNGMWQFSTDGNTWSSFTPAASKTNAYLLSAGDDIRFTPKSNTAGTATLTVYAWDGSVGSNGSKVNLTTLGTGGISAFSTSTLTAVSVVNTAPGLTNSSFALTADNENVASSGITGATLLTKAGYGDPDGKTLPQGIAITGDTGPGMARGDHLDRAAERAGAVGILAPQHGPNSFPAGEQSDKQHVPRVRDLGLPRLGRDRRHRGQHLRRGEPGGGIALQPDIGDRDDERELRQTSSVVDHRRQRRLHADAGLSGSQSKSGHGVIGVRERLPRRAESIGRHRRHRGEHNVGRHLGILQHKQLAVDRD
jgi:hypothetical protein